MSQKRYAYLIGANGPENIRLQYAETDVTRLAETLRGPVCQFTAVESVIAQSRDEGLATLQQFVEQCDASDTLLVHFSGHAFFDTLDQQLYLLCNNTDSNNLITAIDISAIKRILRRSRAQSKLLILDCCHAKAAYDVKSEESEEEIRDLVKKATQGSMSAILSACAGKDKTREFRDLDGGSGFLSWAVRAACSTHLEDASSDPEKKALSLSDLDRWVKRALHEVNTDLNLNPPLPTPYLFSDRAVGNDIWLTPPPSLNGKPSMTGNEENRRRYLNEVAKRYSSVTLPIDSSEGLSLHAIFQPLVLRSDPLAAEDLERKQRRKFLGESLEEEPYDLAETAMRHAHEKSRDINKPAQPKIAQHGEDALSASPQGRIVILGGPGTGKTTTLRYLVSRRAQEALEKTIPNTQALLLPIFLSLADLARSGKTFQSYLQDVVENLMIERSYADVLWIEIERGRAFVALDSLDEVIPALRPQMIEQVNHLAARHGNIWIVGSRFTDYKGGQLKHGQFAEWELLSMTPQLRRELATKLLPELFQLPLAKTKTLLSPLEFVHLLEKHPQAATWGNNPLLFSLAAVVFIKTGGLPSSRSSLYREVIEAILTLKEPESVARRHLLRALTGLSLWLYQEKKGRTFTTDDLFTFLEETQKRSWEEAEIIVRKITTSGILDIVARETYGFRHQTFQEYLAAAELAQQFIRSDEKRAKAYELAWSKRRYSRWTEVLRLMVGVLTQFPEKKGQIEAAHWLSQLIEQRETEEGDPGDLGLTLALTSLAEVGDGERWETGRTREIIQLETHAISLWVEELLDAVRKGRKARAERFQTLAEDIVHLRILGKEVVIQQLIQALRDVDRNVQEAAAKTLKTLGMWISENDLLLLLRNPDPDLRRNVVEVLGNLGDQVPIDRLLPLLEDPSSGVRRNVVQVLGNLGDQMPIDRLLPLLEDPDWQVRYVVVQVLGNLGDQTPIDRLLPLLEDPDPNLRQVVVQVLGDQVPIDRLLPLLEDPSSGVRRNVVQVLGNLGDQVPIDRLLPLLEDPDPDLRQVVVRVLGDQMPIDRLLPLLEDPDPNLRQVVVEVLGDQMPIDRLLLLLEDPSSGVRQVVVQVLGNLGDQTPIDRLLLLLEDPDPNLRQVVVQVLGDQMPIDRLLLLLEDPDPDLRQVVVRVLGDQVPIDRLLPLLENPSSGVRWNVVQVLGDQMPIDRLLPLLEDPSSGVRWNVVQVLGNLGDQMPIDRLLPLLEDPDPNLRQVVVQVLGDQMPIDRLLPLLEDPSSGVRRNVVQVLGNLGDQMPIDRLLPLLEDPDPDLRQVVVRVLGDQMPIDRLLPLLEDPDPNLRQVVVQVLGDQVPIDRLLPLLEDPSSGVRQVVVRVLGDQMPIDRLLPLLEDPDPNLRQVVVEVLGDQMPIDRLLPLLENPDWQVRQVVVQVLGNLGDQMPIDRLLLLLEDPDPNLRQVVVQVLGDQMPIDRLLPLLEDPSSGVRWNVVQVLGNLGDQVPIDRLLPLLEDPDPNLRQVVVQVLGDQMPIDRLLPLLEDPSSGVRRNVVQVLGDQMPIDRLLPLLEDPSSGVRRNVVQVLGDQMPIDRLLPLLEDPSSGVRWNVVQVLGNLGDQVPIDRLLPLLEDPDPNLRQVVVQVLGDQVPIDRLLPLLEDPSSGVRQVVVQVLGTQRKQLLITLLMPYFYQKDEDVRRSAIRILEKRNEPISRDLFMNLLSDESSDIRQTALRILQKQSPQMLSDLASQALSVLDGHIRGQVFSTLVQMQVADTIEELGIASTTLLEKLTELLDWPHWQVRIKAAQVFGQIRRNIPDAALQRLLELRRDPDPNMGAVRDAADDALAEILSLETGIEDD